MMSAMICTDETHDHIDRVEAKQCALGGCDHEWDYGETEMSPVYCVRCGADGLA